MSSNSDLLGLIQGLSAHRDVQLILIALKFIGDDHVGDPSEEVHAAGCEYHDLAQRIQMAIDGITQETITH
jgi:hypothetical protein